VPAINDPKRFRRSSDVGAFLGLTPRRYGSGEVHLAGRISKAGDRPARSLLFEAANALMTRVRHESLFRTGGFKLSAKVGSRRAKTAVARKPPPSFCIAFGWTGGVLPCSGRLSFRRGGSCPAEDAGRIIPKLLMLPYRSVAAHAVPDTVILACQDHRVAAAPGWFSCWLALMVQVADSPAPPTRLDR
jgi:hypothetical protein